MSALALLAGITLGTFWYPNSVSLSWWVSLPYSLFHQKVQPPAVEVHVEQHISNGRNPKSLSSAHGASLGWKVGYESVSQLSFFLGKELQWPFFTGQESSQLGCWAGGSKGKLPHHLLCLMTYPWGSLAHILIRPGETDADTPFVWRWDTWPHDTASLCAFGPPQECNFKKVRKINGNVNGLKKLMQL